VQRVDDITDYPGNESDDLRGDVDEAISNCARDRRNVARCEGLTNSVGGGLGRRHDVANIDEQLRGQ
jgi:hypothetical protein